MNKRWIEVSSKQLYIKSGTKLYRLDIDAILYLEKEGNYIQFMTADKKVLSRLNMTQALEILPTKQFLRVHKSYIIALQHIDVVEVAHVVIIGKRIPVAKNYREVLLEKLTK